MRYLIILIVLMINLAYGQKKASWGFPSGMQYERDKHDTTYYSESKVIWRMKKGNQLYEFYPDGNLQSVSGIKESSTEEYLDTDNVNKIRQLYDFAGVCKIYFDSTMKVLAAIGSYKNNDRIWPWLYYNDKGELIEKEYGVMFWVRSDYFFAGKLIRQVDRIPSDKSSVDVRSVEYHNGKEIVIFDRPFVAKFLLSYTNLLVIIMMVCIFARVPINYILYNRETPNRVFDYSRFGGRMGVQLRVLCTFWWPNTVPESKVLIICHNILSVIGFGLFLGMTFYTVFHPVSFQGS